MMTRAQADATATLVASLRPDWDVRGIMAALRDAAPKAGAAEVAVAAIRAASSTSNRTPAVIPLAGHHWNDVNTSRANVVTGPWDRRACWKCSRFHADGPCQRLDPEAAERGTANARAALAKARVDAAAERDRIAQAITDATGETP